MSSFSNAMMSMLNAANTTSDIVRDYTHEQARLSTQTKEIQLQTDINEELAKIRQSANDEEWNTQINDFFTRVKSGMSDKNSPYYCKNNLQAQQFEAIMEQHRVGVSAKVGQMAEERAMQKDIVTYNNAVNQLENMYFGQQFVDKANELAGDLYRAGRLSPQQYQQQKDLNFKKGYTEARLKAFEASVDDAITNGESYEKLKSRLDSAMPEMKHSDINGLEIDFDKSALDDQINKTLYQSYNAKLSDMQQGNADKLSQIVQRMKQQNSAEARLAVARQGQMTMNGMQGLQLSENDRLKYAAYFDLFTSTKGSGDGSGSGSGSKPTDSFDKLCKVAPDTAYQLWLEGKADNLYDCTNLVSYNLKNEWYTGDYKENFGKDIKERDEDFNMLYKGSTAAQTLTDTAIKMVLEKYPSAKNLMGNNFKGLITDMQKNPQDYGDATVGELADYLLDTLAGSNSNLTNEEFIEGFRKHINDCYVEKCKYIELNKKGELLKKYNAGNAADVAKAARLAQEKDFVFTYGGQERWANGKKEALEAKGGVVDVLKNAVAGTLGIPDAEHGSIGFYYKPDELHDDVTSTPIITYKNKAYEVIPNDDNKGFTLRDYHTKEIIEGSLKGGKAERTENKKAAGNTVKELSEVRKQIESSREVDDAQWADILYDKGMPKAAVAAGVTNAEDWNQSDKYTRITMLTSAARKVTKDAHKVESNKMSEDDFKKKYGFDYSTWNKASTRDKQFYTLLNN
jgi:hypothetical protein